MVTASIVKPYAWHLATSNSCGRPSKAFDKSTRTALTLLLLFKYFFHSSMILKITWLELWSFLFLAVKCKKT